MAVIIGNGCIAGSSEKEVSDYLQAMSKGIVHEDYMDMRDECWYNAIQMLTESLQELIMHNKLN